MKYKEKGDTEMIREFIESNKAVVLDSNNNVLWQLDSNINSLDIITFLTKKEACEYASKMHIQQWKVERINRRFERVYAIKYDPRYPYYMACWEV